MTLPTDAQLDAPCLRCNVTIREHHDLGEACVEVVRLRAVLTDAIGELQCAREAIADRTSVADTRVARALIPMMDALRQ